MAKHLGVRVATVVAAAAASGAFAGVNSAYAGGEVRCLARDYVTVDAAENDTVSLGTFDWDTVIYDGPSLFQFSDFGTSVTLDIGDATYPAALVDGQDIATAAGEARILKSVAIASRSAPLWQMLGHATLAAAKAIADRCELLASFKDANPASGTLCWEIFGSPQ